MAKTPFQTGHQPVGFGYVHGRHFRPRRAGGGTGNGASFHQNMLPQRQTISGLLFVTQNGQIAVEQILGLVHVTGTM